MHLAQLNVARLRAPIDDPSIDDFRLNLDRINTLAEGSPGFVWRLQDDSGNATGFDPFGDELAIVNLSVWESIDALADFTYRSGHVEVLRRRREFFEVPAQASLCLWWVPDGSIPTLDEAIDRLEHLRAHGPTPRAFTFRHRYDPRRSHRERTRLLPRVIADTSTLNSAVLRRGTERRGPAGPRTAGRTGS